MIVLIVNGAPGSGKSEFKKIIRQRYPLNRTHSYSSIAWIKQKAIDLGWDGVKDKKGRQFLSNLKKACIAYNDMPFKKVVEEIKMAEKAGCLFLFTDIREPKEIEKLTKHCEKNNIQCQSILMRCLRAEKEAANLNNTSDMQYMNFEYDHMIWNNYTPTAASYIDLQNIADCFLNKVLS